MPTADIDAPEQSSHSDERRAALIAAAALLQRWVQSQRDRRCDVQTDVTRLTTPSRRPSEIPSDATSAEAGIPVSVVAAEPERLALAGSAVDRLTSEAAAGAAIESTAPDAALSAVTGIAEQPEPTFLSPASPSSFAWVWKAAAAAVVLLALGAAGREGRNVWVRWQASPKTGTAVLESTAVANVRVDGREQGSTPLTLELSAGGHTIEFQRGGLVRTVDVDVVKGQSVTARADWTVHKNGRLEVESTPAGARVLVDGRERGVTPLTIDDLPAGEHTLALQSTEGTVQRRVTVAEEKTTQVAEAIFSGFLHVSSAIELEISEGPRSIRLNDRNQVLLGPGTHQIRFANRALGFSEVRNVEITPGDVTAVSIELPTTRLSVTANVPGEVFIDGERVGETPLVDVPVRLGTRDIVVKSAEGERRITQTLTTAPAHVQFDFSQP